MPGQAGAFCCLAELSATASAGVAAIRVNIPVCVTDVSPVLCFLLQSTREHFPNLVYRVTAHDHSPCPKKKTTVWVTPPADLNVNNNTGLNNITAAGTDFGITLPSGSSSSTASIPATAEAVASRVQEDTNAPGSAVVAVAAAASTSGSSSSSTELTQELQQQSTAQQAAAGGAVSQQAKAPNKKTARFGAECVPAHKGTQGHCSLMISHLTCYITKELLQLQRLLLSMRSAAFLPRQVNTQQDLL